ncbi:cysteine dioxygenase [Paenibacillus sp. MBLB4367]|uniref:cysteine dioxygenase n=1 Tax=Paenibacillus sp. MBLB4367 TaxID=3384767 RepID=UPI003908365F
MESLRELQRLFAGMSGPTPEQLQRAVQSYRFSPAFAETYVTEPESLPYGKNILWTTDAIQAVVIHLPANSSTFIHDHGESVGCALVLEGTIVNTEYDAVTEGLAARISAEEVPAGGFFHADKNQVHRMSNPSDRRAISFHVYSPPLQGARVYQEAAAVKGKESVSAFAD